MLKKLINGLIMVPIVIVVVLLAIFVGVNTKTDTHHPVGPTMAEYTAHLQIACKPNGTGFIRGWNSTISRVQIYSCPDGTIGFVPVE